jgi:hypothetical protein
LAVQSMRPNDRILLIGQLVGLRNGDGWFAPDEVHTMHEALRIPDPHSVPRSLSQLRNSGLVRPRGADHRWCLTPLGSERAATVIGGFDYGLIHEELLATPGVDFMNVRYSVIPPSLAPPRWQIGVRRFLEQFPFETNVFCMTRFPGTQEDELPDPLREVIDTLREVLPEYGLTFHLASDRQIEDDLWGNVGAHMWACQYGIGLLEGRGTTNGQLNTNMLIELGSMLTMGRRCAILKDKTADRPPTDLSGQIYKSVDFAQSDTVVDAVEGWVTNDLALP